MTENHRYSFDNINFVGVDRMDGYTDQSENPFLSLNAIKNRTSAFQTHKYLFL